MGGVFTGEMWLNEKRPQGGLLDGEELAVSH